MKKFKVFTASVLTYLMLLSLVPSNFAQMIARASESEDIEYVTNDYYFSSVFQYKDSILTLKSVGEGYKILLYKSGEETVLKEIINEDEENGYVSVSENKISSTKVQFVEKFYNYTDREYDIRNVYEYDVLTDTFTTLPKESYTSDSSLYLGEYRTTYQGKEPEYRVLFQEVLNKVNKKYNTEYTLSMFNCDDEQSYNNIYFKIIDKYGRNNLSVGSNLISLDDCLISFRVYVDGENGEERFSGLYNSKFEFVNKDAEGVYSTYEIIKFDIDNDELYISEKVSEDISVVYKIKNDKVISTKKLNFNSNSLWRIIDIQDDNIFIDSRYQTGEISILNLDGDSYINNGSSIKANMQDGYGIDPDGNLWLAQKDNKDIKISKYENGQVVTKEILKNVIDKEKIIYPIVPYVYNENNIFITSADIGSIFINKVEEVPVLPEDPSEDEKVPVLPEDPNDPSDDEVVTPPVGGTNKPSEDTVVEIPVEALKPNEVNEISEVAEDKTNFNIIVKDIEALKNGQGSLKAMLNDVTLNLPFSVLDKDLLGENDTVSVKLDVLTNSEITKELKAVNKVFDFNLVVNKENGEVNIHNFKDGVAEITVALSDVELQGLNKDKLKVYYYNEETKKFEAMETKVEGNNVTFKTSHFSKYVIAEEIVNNTVPTPDDEVIIKPDIDKDDSVVTPDNDNEITIKPDESKPNTDGETNNNTNDNTTNNEQNKTEAGKGELPTTGSVVSNNIILVLALGVVLIGGVIFFRKKKVA